MLHLMLKYFNKRESYPRILYKAYNDLDSSTTKNIKKLLDFNIFSVNKDLFVYSHCAIFILNNFILNH